MTKTWKPTAGGICSIVGGAFGIMGGFLAGVLGVFGYGGMPGMWGMWGTESYMMPWRVGLLGWFGLPALVLGAVAIVGGIFALKRQRWGIVSRGRDLRHADADVVPSGRPGDSVHRPFARRVRGVT